MSEFDDAFASRVREVFQDYQEPVDPAALAQMRAALGHPPSAAPDRAPVARQQTRARRGRWVALAAAVVAVGVGVAAWLGAPEASAPDLVASAEAPGPEARPDAQDVGTGLDAEAGAQAFGTPATAPTVATAPPPPEAPAASERAGTSSRLAAGAAAPSVSPTDPAPVAAAVAPSAESTAGPAPAAPALTAPAPLAADASATGAGTTGATEATQPERPAAEPARPALPALSLPAEPVAQSQPDRQRGGRSPYRVEIATSTPLAGEVSASGLSVSGGVTREWPVAGPLSVSSGALLAYNRYDVELDAAVPRLAFSDLGPSESLDVPASTRAETVALEIPLDVALTVARTRSVRLGVSVGVTSAVYLAQEFDDQGTSYSAAPPMGGASGDVASETFRTRDRQAPLSRVELARQLNLGVQIGRARGGIAADVFARLPLGGLTDRDLGLTSAGVRLRVPLR